MDVPATLDEIEAAHALREWLSPLRRVFVLTGAGISTASGIPDYRDEAGGWKRQPPESNVYFAGFAARKPFTSSQWVNTSNHQ